MSARWYVVNVYSGSEKKVAESLKEQILLKNMQDRILEVFVPTVTEIDPTKVGKKGKKAEVERKFFPGYILVKMEMSDETWSVVKSTPRVSGFLGSRNKPQAVSDSEVEKIMNQIKERKENPQANVSYETGEQVRVIDGPFASFVGIVEDVDNEKSRLKVSVSIFGRYTPVELEFSQVEKA